MDRRDALKSLAVLAGATGMTVTPVLTHEATDVRLVILKLAHPVSMGTAERLRSYWLQACEGTALAGVKVIVFDGQIEAQFVRGRA